MSLADDICLMVFILFGCLLYSHAKPKHHITAILLGLAWVIARDVHTYVASLL